MAQPLIGGAQELGKGCCCIDRSAASDMISRWSCLPVVDRQCPALVFTVFWFPVEVFVLAPVSRHAMSYRDVVELLAERWYEVDHVTVYRSVQRFTPLPADAARRRDGTVVVGSTKSRSVLDLRGGGRNRVSRLVAILVASSAMRLFRAPSRAEVDRVEG